MKPEKSPMAKKAQAAFRAAMLDVIETCRRTKTPLITSIDGGMKHIPYDQIEQYIDIESLREPDANGSSSA
ncbi:hypothetical protein [Blastopirellula marina]|uniref:Uncharacterized protein n=1 Tax=Blastopirellula marina TaxID=124 RepID=A0A2S8GLG4_9BACT|nr:hypothetical protein [Blastopirellula marina]PQO45272.1 hypothetical protein C5Y93_15045 [Blastopirellula marina]